MRTYILATLERRSGSIFTLKNGLITIGSMVLNGAKARHEMELSEADFLKHAKSLAQICRTPGCAVYVAEIRDTAAAARTTKGKEVSARTPFFTLRSIAKAENVDISNLATNAERAAAINEARKSA